MSRETCQNFVSDPDLVNIYLQYLFIRLKMQLMQLLKCVLKTVPCRHCGTA